MSPADSMLREESLDPEDWDSMRVLGHQMIDDMMTYLQTVRERPVWQSVPEETKARFRRSLPMEPQEADDVYGDFLHDVLPYPMGNIHPRFWGWVIGTGTPLGALAEMWAAGMNPNVGGGEQRSTLRRETSDRLAQGVIGLSRRGQRLAGEWGLHGQPRGSHGGA